MTSNAQDGGRRSGLGTCLGSATSDRVSLAQPSPECPIKKKGLMIEHPSSQVPSRPNQTETSYGAQEDAQQVLYLQAEGACRLGWGRPN